MHSMEHESPTHMAEEGLSASTSVSNKGRADGTGQSQHEEAQILQGNEVVLGGPVTRAHSDSAEGPVVLTDGQCLQGETNVDEATVDSRGVPSASDHSSVTTAQTESLEIHLVQSPHQDGNAMDSIRPASTVELCISSCLDTDGQSSVPHFKTDSDRHSAEDGKRVSSLGLGDGHSASQAASNDGDNHMVDSIGVWKEDTAVKGCSFASDTRPVNLEEGDQNTGDTKASTENVPVKVGVQGQNVSNQISGPFTRLVDFGQLSAAGLTDAVSLGQGGESADNLQHDFKSLLNSDTHTNRLKKFLRSATLDASCSVRQCAWKLLCGHLHKLQGAGVYLEVESEMFGDFTDEDEIPLPTWLQPQQRHQQQQALVDQFSQHFLTREGIITAHKVVTVICHLSPDITFCPALLPVVYLFLHYMDVGDCFSCVSALLSSKIPVYLTQTKVAAEASKRVLQDLTKKHAKSAFVHLVRGCTSVEAVFDDWLLWIYCDLPFQYLVQLTDSYLLEGMKVLYRVGLAILMLFTKYSGSQRTSHIDMNMGSSIRAFCQSMPVSPAKLFKVAFGVRGLSRRRILKLQMKHERQVNSVPQQAGVPHVASTSSMGDVSSRIQTRTLGFQKTQSTFLTTDMLHTIWDWLPVRYAGLTKPVLLFTSAEHGTSLRTLYSHIEDQPYTVIVIQTTTGEVFGAFCAGAWNERRTCSRNVSYFGTGETFLFTLVPERCKYDWVGILDPHVPHTANMFLAGDDRCLIIGGGKGEAISLDETFEHCRTEACDTFQNPPLCPQQDFTCNTVEVFGLQ
ncbi:hypothetical protein BaRGS_00009502 [Batillaria attramentaria]|uniref:TLDc domain-containing protein n=1 Tax=Batillaria attramentaria TaxID=370345 RepID=A0ABD0LJR8_9CAEN